MNEPSTTKNDVTTVEHTPTPWKAESTLIWAPDAKANIAQVSELRAGNDVRFTAPSISSPDFHEVVANAEFIVRACNSHASLLAALEGLASGIVEHFPGEGRVTCRACDKTFLEELVEHEPYCPVVAANKAIQEAS